ncbi:glycosyltransferase family 4 protein [Clostridium sp. M62/1]|uniref:glycosyltransferase family 4 protein n=1 Tax=Clostridium sp. M62/1 TaxID=411486 RepID=UPI0001C34E8C|nr:glycosyltransferase family 4 protein [Clostridium sp. M62/1]EFE11463.1 glycosyltransferase, group 1 family protein [Clostridium sp. M62/1]UEB77492.1 glycosyltransferase family 4 protein [Clostridium sp. M62/1]CCY84167.1 glycosyltransferase group 1 family protein [Clostridium sp. CAG:149]
MKKVLFVATVVKTHINVFHIPFLKLFKDKGYETYVCARNDFVNKNECIIPYCDYYHDIPFSRQPFHLDNIKAYYRLKKVIEDNHFDIIHCHTPVGGAITRLIKKNMPDLNAKLIYTAHGFHFFKGAKLTNWIIYYPIEKWLAQYTDILITINQEDYERAKSFKCGELRLVNGIGIKFPEYGLSNAEIEEKREQLSLEKKDIVLVSVGELIQRKNHALVIKALGQLKKPHIKYLICGNGRLEKKLTELIEKNGLRKQVYLLGFRNDINAICQVSDIFLFPSLQEGLPVALMEAMANKMPVIATDIRGNHDLIQNNEGGILISPNSTEDMKNAILYLTANSHLWPKMGEKNFQAVQNYALDKIVKEMQEIYFGNNT